MAETENTFSWSAFDKGGLLCNCFLSVHALQQHTFAVFPLPGKNCFVDSAPKVALHFSFSLHSHTSSFSLLTFLLYFSHFFPSYKDIFNASEAVEFLANWLKLAAQRFGQNAELQLCRGRAVVLTISQGKDFNRSKRPCLLLCGVGVNSARLVSEAQPSRNVMVSPGKPGIFTRHVG